MQPQETGCPVSHDQLVQALEESVKASGGEDNGGLPVNEWAVVVDRTGVVCAIGFSGERDRPVARQPRDRVGASGNTSCSDHNIAWRVRDKVGLGKVPAGPSPHNNDAIIYDVGADGTSKSGWGHTICGMNGAEVAESIGAGVVTVEQTAAAKSPRPESTPSASTMDTLIQNATTPLDTTPDRTVVPAKKAD